jgi:SAM-dependent methyltransferase
VAPQAESRDHWERLGGDYAADWSRPARRLLSERELGFVAAGLATTRVRTALDIGVGSGRILAELLRRSDAAEIYGVDAAAAMVESCRERFADEPRIRDLRVVDVAREPLPFENVDFISSIRVLKYSENWRAIVAKIGEALAPGGAAVFSMPNSVSLNRLSRPYEVPWHSVSRRGLEEVCRDAGLEPVEVRGFTKLPHGFETRPRRPAVAAGVAAIDGGLAGAIGDAWLARELFVIARRA